MAVGADNVVIPENTKFPLIAIFGCVAGNGADPVYVGGVRPPANDILAFLNNGAVPVYVGAVKPPDKDAVALVDKWVVPV